MKILVTGGTGFTGSALVKRLISRGNEVTVLDNQRGIMLDSLEALGAKVTIGSITDTSVVESIVKVQEVIYHLAAAFRKVNLPSGSPRGGLLGMAAIHAMGSDGVKSSPVERGAWVLRHLLQDPPPPAPPNVPQISRLADKPLTTRERLAAHMEEAQCASCHRKIDPIGFGLENFDAALAARDAVPVAAGV